MSFYSRKYIDTRCDCFAFYKFQKLSPQKLEEWFEYTVSLAEEFGYSFKEGVCMPGNKKYVAFNNCKRIFEKNLNAVNSIELRHLIDKEPFDDEGVVSAHFDNEYGDFNLGIYESLLLNENQKLKIMIKFCELLKPKYAMCYKFPVYFGLWHYAVGFGSGGYDTAYGSKYYNKKHVDLRDGVLKWDHTFKKDDFYTCGYLREIYPINFINEKHLNHEVFPKVTLRDWIEADDHRGTLTQITDELHMWLVPDEDLEPITIALAPSDILLCVNKEDPHRYDYGVRPEDQIILEK